MTFTNSHEQLTPVRDPAVLVRATRATGRRGERRISLALQGGGAFGAFTWGVLDRLLEANVPFDAVSGASAGAMNAVVVASGLALGGPEHARVGLERFWRKVSNTAERARRSPLVRSGTALATIVPRISPYQFNPFDLNPLREILREEIDFEAVRTRAPVRLLIGATRVRDGALRIFRNDVVTPEVVLASSCLPHIHHAVEIDGEPHWDGGYAANPPLMQLVTATRVPDLLVVQVIPTSHAELPTTSPEIDKRIGQITFSGSLQKDLEALSMMRKLSLAEGGASNSRLGRKLQQLQLHRIAAEDHVDGLSGMSVLNAEWTLLTQLRDHGRAAAAAWLD
jgi:NTE family protein